MKKLLPMIALAACAVGCQSYQYNKGGDADLRPTIVRDIAYEKFDISNKPIEVTVSTTYLKFFKWSWSLGSTWDKYADNVDNNVYVEPHIAKVRNQAYSMACAEAKCDSIVGAQYEIKRDNKFIVEDVTVTLKGYPAKLTGVEFRPAVFAK
ncbi:MAG: hypothetical protein Q4G65_13260 [bacterium]|nr:hypothetical protein [bacterium]